jgi:hypothetical protein
MNIEEVTLTAGASWGDLAAGLARLMTMSHPRWDRIERRAIEFPIIGVGDPNRAAFCLQFRADNAQFACKLFGSIRGKFEIFENKTALVLEFFADYEIKIVVGHRKLPISVCSTV